MSVHEQTKEEEFAVDAIITKLLLSTLTGRGFYVEEISLVLKYEKEITERLNDMTRKIQYAVADARAHSPKK